MQLHTNVLAAAAVDYIQIGITVQYKMATAFAEAIFLSLNGEGIVQSFIPYGLDFIPEIPPISI
ncbi:hypothetical protein J7I80_13350 [Bacillus sp. ISL-41]|uniref:hypothetical protein n=1 Tax=Bacillus sp. ISL-41 TaxID=2819127 RepID=UPI001BE6DA61|nr:hypothetical protein [Bacillus sp. ISL-41]MBT2643219.1 hypothetical protein [Bacillus sp. ISL-41]